MDNLVQQLDDMVAQLRVKTDCTTSGANVMLHAVEPEVLSTASVKNRPVHLSSAAAYPTVTTTHTVTTRVWHGVHRYRRFLTLVAIMWGTIVVTDKALEKLGLRPSSELGRSTSVWRRLQRQMIVGMMAVLSAGLVLYVTDRAMR
ncbi:hypothetical protein EBZ80_15965 [bacterium]|nr:hypothetical protein [bacterium]